LEAKRDIRYKIRTSLLLLSGLLAFYWIYFVFLGISLSSTDTANQLKREILTLSQEKKYNEIVKKSFHILYLDSTQQDANFWNLASAYYMLNQRKIAQNFYDTLRQTALVSYQARALHQIGNILYLQSPDSLEATLQLYKNSLYLQDNPETRYNYELLKKIQAKNNPVFKQSTTNPNNQQVKKQEKTSNEDEKYSENTSPDDFLEAISNQEQEQIRKYQLKKVKNTNTSLPDW